MADIFISYSSKDKEKADQLTELLASAGLSVWIDRSGIEAATSWSKEIAKALTDCKSFFLLLSEHSLSSPNVAKELAVATELKKHILPVELEAVDLRDEFLYHLAGVQRVSYSNHEGILHAIQKLGLSAAAPLPPTMPQPAGATSRSVKPFVRIAVLPFEDQSPAHDNEWFSEGLTDELIFTLNKLDALFVLDKKSSALYREAKLSTKQIAHELGVDYIVSGAVRKAAEKIRVQASLIDATTGATIWTEKFNGTIEDIFEIQEKTAFDIVEGLKLTLTPEETILLEEKMTNSPAAYQLYLQAREASNSRFDFFGAIELLKRALEIDPKFIPAYSSISIGYANAYRSTKRTEKKLLDLSKEAIDRIQELDPTSPFYFGPKANYYLNIGEKELALEMAQKYVELQPKKSNAYAILGFIQDSLGNRKGAAEAYEKCIELEPNSAMMHGALIWALHVIGDRRKIDAIAGKTKMVFEQTLKVMPDNSTLKIAYMHTAEIIGEKDISVRIADEAELWADNSPLTLAQIAGIWIRNDQIERGIQTLRKAISAGFSDFEEVDITWYEAIKATPEYQFIFDHITRR